MESLPESGKDPSDEPNQYYEVLVLQWEGSQPPEDTTTLWVNAISRDRFQNAANNYRDPMFQDRNIYESRSSESRSTLAGNDQPGAFGVRTYRDNDPTLVRGNGPVRAEANMSFNNLEDLRHALDQSAVNESITVVNGAGITSGFLVKRVKVIVDTGADVSLMDENVAKYLRLRINYRPPNMRPIRQAEGTQLLTKGICLGALYLKGHSYPHVFIIPQRSRTDKEYEVILGNDILAKIGEVNVDYRKKILTLRDSIRKAYFTFPLHEKTHRIIMTEEGPEDVPDAWWVGNPSERDLSLEGFDMRLEGSELVRYVNQSPGQRTRHSSGVPASPPQATPPATPLHQGVSPFRGRERSATRTSDYSEELGGAVDPRSFGASANRTFQGPPNTQQSVANLPGSEQSFQRRVSQPGATSTPVRPTHTTMAQVLAPPSTPPHRMPVPRQQGPPALRPPRDFQDATPAFTPRAILRREDALRADQASGATRNLSNSLTGVPNPSGNNRSGPISARTRTQTGSMPPFRTPYTPTGQSEDTEPGPSQPARRVDNPAVAEISNEIRPDPIENSGRVNLITQDVEPLVDYGQCNYDDQVTDLDFQEHVAHAFLEDLAPPPELTYPDTANTDVQTDDYHVRMLKFARDSYDPQRVDSKLSRQYCEPFHVKVLSKPPIPRNTREDRSNQTLLRERGKPLTKSLENLPIESQSFLAVYEKRMERGLFSTPLYVLSPEYVMVTDYLNRPNQLEEYLSPMFHLNQIALERQEDMLARDRKYPLPARPPLYEGMGLCYNSAYDRYIVLPMYDDPKFLRRHHSEPILLQAGSCSAVDEEDLEQSDKNALPFESTQVTNENFTTAPPVEGADCNKTKKQLNLTRINICETIHSRTVSPVHLFC